MAAPSGIVVQNMWDVTIVNFEEARLLEVHVIDQIAEQLFKLVDQMDKKKLVLDFSKVQFLASAAVGMLMNLHKKSLAIRGQLVLCGMKKEIMKVFEIMQLTKVLKFAPDEKEALKMLGYKTDR